MNSFYFFDSSHVSGEHTIVRCFYCDGAMQNWTSKDNPSVEHARWFPRCAYSRQMIGDDMYEAIQRKNRALKCERLVDIIEQ
jgi:hypothetical protein